MLVRKEVLEIKGVASQDDKRYALNGVYFIENCENVKAVATDGRMLLEATFPKVKDSEYPTVPGDENTKDTIAGGIVPLGAIMPRRK